MPVTISGDSGITTPDLTDTSLTSGRVVYAGASGNLTGASTFVFDGSNLGVGTSSPAEKLEVSGGANTAIRVTASSGNSVFRYARAGVDKWTTYVPDTDDFIIYSNAAATERARIPAAGGFQSVNSISVGNATPTTSGAGITFPATQSASSNANTLDDYEEGSWTPSYSGGLSGVTYGTVRNGFYTKIGNQVTVWFGIMTDGLTVTSSSLNISGLPFTSKSSFGAFNTVNLCSAVRWVSSPPIVGELVINTTTINLISNFNLTGAGTDPTLVTTGNMATGSGNRNVIYGTATYTV